MVTHRQQINILDALSLEYYIQDVYFHKGTLYVINDYDVHDVNECLHRIGLHADVIIMHVEEFA